LSLHRTAKILAASRLCAVIAGVIAAIAPIGYAFDLPLLIHVHMGLKGMSPVTAMALLALAIAAFASTYGRRRIAQAGSVLAAAAAASVIACHIAFGSDIISPWIGGAVFRMRPGITNHMSYATGYAILLVAAALIMRRRTTGGADLSAGIGLLLSGMALLGYLYGVGDLYALPMFNDMALNTAAALFILSMAALLSAPEHGWASILGSEGMGGVSVRRQLPLVALPILAGWILLMATDAKRFGPAIAMALLVISTIAPMAILVLRDGHLLNVLDRERRGKSDMRERLEREVAERFRLVVEASPGAVIMVDSAGLMTLVNRKTERLFGYARAELLGQPIELLVPSQLRETHAGLVKSFAAAPKARVIGSGWDLFGHHRDGNAIPLEIGLNPILIDGASFTLAAITDLTQRKRAADDMERSNQDLEQFAYAISHDLRTPLQAIRNLTEWIGEDIGAGASPETIRNLARVAARTERLENMLEGLLEYSRIGRMNAAPELIDTAALVRDIIESLMVRQGFVVEIGPMQPVFAIRSPLEQVLQNLIGNALKHHDHNEGLIVVSCRDLGAHVEFTVKDDGPGVAPEFHKKIFAIFQALKPSQDGKIGGIGLAIVKKAVEANGGAIQVISDPPRRGTAFVFTWKKRLSISLDSEIGKT
jgi:PAS domain S-box-containing protein